MSSTTQQTLDGGLSEEHECPWDGCERSFDSEGGMKKHHKFIHGESISGILVNCSWCDEEIRVSRRPHMNLDRRFCPDKDCFSKWKSENQVGENNPCWRGGKVTKQCDYCGETVERRPSKFHDGNVFCDIKCEGKWQSKNIVGPNHPNWKDTTVKRPYKTIRSHLGKYSWSYIYKEHKEKDSECYMCGEDGENKRIELHHIIPIMSGGTNDEYNLMPLCSECHRGVEPYTNSIIEPIISNALSKSES